MKLLAAVTLLCYLAAALPVRYAADDFADAQGIANLPGAMHGFYNGWSGRYTYGLTKTISKLGGEATAFVPAMLVLLALWWLVDDKLLLVAVATASPALIESIYWNAGATGYGLALVGVAACIKLRIGRLATLLLAFVTAGLSETMVVAMPLLFVAWYAWNLDRRALYALAGALLGLCLTLVSPGIAIRAAYFQRADLPTTLSFAVRSTGVYAAMMLRDAPLSVLALVAVPILAGCTVRRDTRKLLILATTALAVSFACAFTAFYSTGGPLPPRAAIIPIAVIGAALFYGARYSGLSRPMPRLARALVILVFLTGCVQAVSIANAWLHVKSDVDNIGNAFQ